MAALAMALVVPLDRVTVLVGEGVRVELSGAVTTSLDGAALGPRELFDFAAGGLAVVGSNAAAPAGMPVVLAPTGGVGAGCEAAGVSSPCLVPRLGVLAHQRLRTAGELAATLTGAVELSAEDAPAGAPGSMWSMLHIGLASAAGAALVVAIALWAAVAVVRRRARTALGRVRRAARRALRATAGDITLRRARVSIQGLWRLARQVDRSRRTCLRALRRVDRVADAAEAARLDDQYAASVAELERIEAALGAVAARAGSAAVAGPEADAPALRALLATELDLRDQAVAEAETLG